MKRTTVLLPDRVAQVLKQEAERRGTTPSAIVRDAVVDHLIANSQKKGFLTLAGMFRSGRRDIAQRAEEILAEGIEDMAEQNGLARRDR